MQTINTKQHSFKDLNVFVWYYKFCVYFCRNSVLMKRLMLFFYAFIMVVFLNSCGLGKYEVFKLDQQNDFLKKEGMFYFLPRTVINFEVTIEKTDHIKGPYAAFSAKYLGISNVITENITNYSIVDLKIKSQNEPDPDKIFFIAFPACKSKKHELLISLKENGIIESVNIDADSLSVQHQQLKYSSMQNEFEEEGQPFKMFINYNILEKVDTIFEFIHLDTMTIEKQVYKRSVIEKNIEQRAKEASEYIIKLNEYKMNLLSGYQEVSYSDATLSFMISSLDQMISEYMSLFTGKTITQAMTYNFTHIPETSTKNTSLFLFSFDKNEGLKDIESSDPSRNIYVEFMPSLTTSKIAPIVNNQYQNSRKSKGFYYNIPEKTKLILSKGKNESIFESNVMINQFGVVHYLPAKHYKILYFDNSASLRRIQ